MVVVWSWRVNSIRCEVVTTLMQWLWCSVEAVLLMWVLIKTTVDNLRVVWIASEAPMEPLMVAGITIEHMRSLWFLIEKERPDRFTI